MRRIAFLVLASLLIGLLPAKAQQVGINFLGNQFSTIVPTIQSFVNPVQLPQQTGRQTCEIQYVAAPGATNGDLSIGFVFFGPANPTTINSFNLAVRNFINCETVNGEVDGNAIWLAATVSNGTFVIKVK